MGQRRIAAAQFVAALRNQAEVIVKSVNGSRLPVGNTMEFPGTALAEGIENPIVTDSDEKKEGITMAKEITVRKTEAPTAWRPFSDFDQWERDAQRMMEQFFGRPFMPWWPERWLRSEAIKINGCPARRCLRRQGRHRHQGRVSGHGEGRYRGEPEQSSAHPQRGEKDR
jgi:hypothetical protein